jgi:hypothetical protein
MASGGGHIKNIAEFTLIGRIGKITAGDGVTRLSIASNHRRKGKEDAWIDDPHWNQIVVFNEGTHGYIPSQKSVLRTNGQNQRRGDWEYHRGTSRNSFCHANRCFCCRFAQSDTEENSVMAEKPSSELTTGNYNSREELARHSAFRRWLWDKFTNSNIRIRERVVA